MKRRVAGGLLFVALLALPALAQRGMSAGHGFGGRGGSGVFIGGRAAGGHGFAPRGFIGHPGFVGHPGFIGHPGFVGHHGTSIFIGTFPSGHFHHGFHHRFFPGSVCFNNPFLCGGGFGFGFDPFFAGGWGWGWNGSWSGYGLPYTVNYSDAYNGQVQATLAEQQQTIADLEEQVRQERLNRMEADSAQPAPAPTTAPATQGRAEQPLTPTVLVFRDHRQMEVSNYAIMGNTLYEFAAHWTRRIPLAELDIPATVKANQDRGIKFRVPSSQAQVVTRP